MGASSTVRVIFMGNSASAVRSVNQLSGAFGWLSRAAGFAQKALVVGIIGGLALATKAAISFDKEMRNVNSIAKLSESQFQKTSKQVLALAKASGQMPTTLAKGLYDIASSGFSAADGIKILTVTSKAATAGLTDTQTATKAVVAVLNAYHLEAGKAGKVADILFQTVNKGVLTFEELASQIGDVLPIAAQLGVPLEDVGGALATITLHGVNAAEASTQLKQVLVSILKPSDDLARTMKKWGFESGEVALKTLGLQGFMRKLTEESKGSAKAFADWFPNVRAMNGALGITGKNVDQLTRNIKAMSERGAAGAAFAEQGKSIAVQWQKARAALVAAAIPVGQLLFPALKAGAEKVGEFAIAIQSNMPMIRAQFAEVASAAGTLAGAMADIGRSREGQVAIAGLVSAFAGARTAEGIRGFVAGLRSIHPAVAVTAGAFAILGAAIMADITHVDRLRQAFDAARGAAQLLGGALDNQKQAHLTVRQASTSLATAQMALAGAQELARKAADQYGGGSKRHKEALHNVRVASDQLAQAKQNLKMATKNAEKADREAAAAAKESAVKVAAMRVEAGKLRDRYLELVPAGKGAGRVARETTDAMKAGVARDYADKIAAITRAMGGTKKEANLAREAVLLLHSQLGRLPTQKQVNIMVNILQRGGSVAAIARQEMGPGRSRAVGGFVPGGPGQAVPIMAHAGEIILNRRQQEMLGGPRFLADLFGFQGDRGPSFAAGGFVGRRSLRAKPSPWRKLRKRSKASTGAARTALAAVEAVNQSQTNLDRMYGQLAREFDISQEQFLVDGADGSQVLDPSAVGQRLNEIDRLIEHRNQMLALIDQEKEELEKAIAALRAAIKALQESIRAEVRAANEDAKAIRRLEQKKNRSAADEKQIERLRASESGHRDKASTFQSTLSDLNQGLADSRDNLVNSVPFDRRDVELDLMELRAERVSVAATRAPVSSGGFGGSSGGDGGSISDSFATEILGSDLSEVLEEARRTIGQLRLALGLEQVQLPIIGQFQKGALHVPQTGLYQLHAGESVTPSGVNRAPRAGGDSRHVIDIDLGDALNAAIKEQVVGVTDEIAVHIGYEGDRRRRGGRA